MNAPDWKQEYLSLISDCETRDKRMTDWEKEFIASLRRQLEEGRRPSPKQVDVLDRVWEKVTKRG